MAILRAVFHNPEALHPVRTSVAVTQDAARQFAEIAAAMRKRGLEPAAVAHFLDRLVFCLFADDTVDEEPLQFAARLRAAHYHAGQDNVVQDEPSPTSANDHRAAISAAAKKLHALRESWLNPPEWTREEILEFPGTVGGPWDRYIDPATAISRGGRKVGTVRYPRLVARDAACAARLKERTLTKLYNQRPDWLAVCHATLDAAVAAAYGWPPDLTDEAILDRLLALNQAAAGGNSSHQLPPVTA